MISIALAGEGEHMKTLCGSSIGGAEKPTHTVSARSRRVAGTSFSLWTITLLAMLWAGRAMADTAGFNAAAACVDNPSIGTEAWNNPANAGAPDGTVSR